MFVAKQYKVAIDKMMVKVSIFLSYVVQKFPTTVLVFNNSVHFVFKCLLFEEQEEEEEHEMMMMKKQTQHIIYASVSNRFSRTIAATPIMNRKYLRFKNPFSQLQFNIYFEKITRVGAYGVHAMDALESDLNGFLFLFSCFLVL